MLLGWQIFDSRVALHFVREVQIKAQFAYARERGYCGDVEILETE
jgi:hypothetical protein